MRWKQIRILALGICATSAVAAFAGEASESELKPVAVAVFKNGLAFVVREGSVKVAAGEAKIPFIPMATLGTLWVAPNDTGTSLEELVAYQYDEKTQTTADTVAQILDANPGKTVTVSFGQREYTGEIVGLRAEQNKAEEAAVSDSANSAMRLQAGPQYLLLKSEGKLVALPLGGLGSVSFPADATLRVDQTESKTALRMKLKGANDHAKLTMAYLERGLGWTPSYLVALKDDKTAQLTLQAVVSNDVEDVQDAEMFFVVGVPNFAYSNIPSPMALQQTLTRIEEMEQNRLAINSRQFSNALQGQYLGGAVGGLVTDAEAQAPNLSNGVSELSGAPEEDLFLYSHAGTTLKRGERATYDVFSAPVEIEHIYQWDIADTSRVDGNGNVISNYNAQNTSDQNALNSVWHSLRMKNATKFPWTSAPALAISGTKPLAQDVLPYTPKGATSNLKLTIATDVRASQQELEADRQTNVPHRPPYRYDLVTVEGTLKLENYKTKDIHLTIHKSLRGEVISSTDSGKAEKVAHGIELDNPSSQLSWDLTLKAGEKKTITYRYKVYARY